MNQKLKRGILISGVLIFVFLIVYSPHFSYKLPYHIDEWKSIGEARQISEGQYNKDIAISEIGFHLFLYIISRLFNLIEIYHIFAALWATISAAILFYFVYDNEEKSDEGFIIALISIIFFASIKSNINILGLWFFVPLTFSIPLIYLNIFFLKKGFDENKLKYFIYSFIIILILIFTHSISFFAFIPAILIYCIINHEKIKRKKILILFTGIIGFVGIIFFKIIVNASWQEVFPIFLEKILFKRGWGVAEYNNPFTELYSIIGYFFAFIGYFIILRNKKLREKDMLILLIPITLFFMIMFFRITGYSPLSPHQRNLYYFILFIPYFSAIGFYNLFFKFPRNLIKKYKLKDFKKIIVILITTFLILLSIIGIFYNYYNIKKEVRLNQMIKDDDYRALLYLSKLNEKGNILTNRYLAPSIYPISGNNVIIKLNNKKNKDKIDIFYNLTRPCSEKNEILKEFNIKYVYSIYEFPCYWDLIYKKDNRYIYKIY